MKQQINYTMWTIPQSEWNVVDISPDMLDIIANLKLRKSFIRIPKELEYRKKRNLWH